MRKYRKKPVVIEADQFQFPASQELKDWLGQAYGDEVHNGKWELTILTLEDGADGRARHVATDGDWIIRGVKGEFYACKPDIFDATYEAVED